MTHIMKFMERASQLIGHCIEDRVTGACIFNQIFLPLIGQVGLSGSEWCIKNNSSQRMTSLCCCNYICGIKRILASGLNVVVK